MKCKDQVQMMSANCMNCFPNILLYTFKGFQTKATI